jgi:hydrogenase/urease accessory protein HupE
MIRRLGFVLVMLAAWLPASLSAHALDPGYLDLVAMGEDRWRVTWRAPNVGGRPMPIEARLPEACSFDAPPPPVFDGRAWTTGWVATCPGGLEGGRIEIAGLERTSTDTLVRYELQPGETQVHRLTSAETGFTVPEDPGDLDILSSYVALGVTHILEGVDHLLFVFALLLLIRDRARLLWAITAFTVAHSITLAAASLGWLNIPPPPVEAVIALSIVFLAYELSLPPEARDPVARRFPWVVSFAFGLIHGLGFAGALREIGLPERDIPLALFSFNVGVELGQILFVVLVVIAGASARRLYPEFRQLAAPLTRTASYGIGGLAAFWVIDRVASF